MSIKAADVKKLRDETGAGMMDCKKALTDAEGDFAQAVKLLKERGMAAAAKRSGRATEEGRIFTMIKDGKAGIIEIGCETDFVARNTDFIAMGEKLVSLAIDKNYTESNDELDAIVQETISNIKENMTLKRIALMDIAADECVVSYTHGETAGIGVLTKVKTDSAATAGNEKVKEFAFDCALHAAAFGPIYLNEAAVDEAYLKEQEEIFTAQASQMDKPANVIAGIVKGKLKKHLAEICFTDQPFVKDDKLSVKQAGDQVGKEIGGKVELVDFIDFRVGA